MQPTGQTPPNGKQLGTTQYYSRNLNGNTTYQAMANAGNDPFGYTNISQQDYVKGLTDTIANAKIAGQTPPGYVGNAYNQDQFNALKKQLSDAQTGNGMYSQGYIDPSFSKYQSNAPTPSAEYLTPQAKAQYDSSMANFQGLQAKVAQGQTVAGPSSPVSNQMLGSGSAMSPSSNTSSYSGPSIVDYLSSVGKPNDYATRATMAQQMGISNYQGTAEQNTQMLNSLRNSPLAGGGSGTQTGNTTGGTIGTGTGAGGTAGTGTGTGTTVSNTTGSTTGTPMDNSINSLLQQYTDANKYSDQYLQDIGALNKNNADSANLTAGQLGFNANAETDHTMSTGAVSGFEADRARITAAQTQALAAQSVPLQQKLAIDQAQRQASIDVANTKLGLATTSVPYGANNTNLLTGQINTNNNPSSDPRIATAIANGQLTPDMVTRVGAGAIIATLDQNPNYNFITGAANKAQTIAEATNKSQLKFDAYGNPIYFTPTVGAGNNGAGNSNVGSNNSNSGSLGNGYTVKPGDIFHQIALNNGMTNDQLAALNPQIADISKITPGQKINLSAPNNSNQSSGISFNPGSFPKATNAAITDQLKQKSDVQRAITAADDNFNLLTSTFKGKVNDYSAPLANQINNGIQKGLFGNSDVINFQSAVSTLQTEYASILGRGGEVTDSVRKSAENVINGNYSMNDLISLHNYIDKEGKNVVGSYDKALNNLSGGSSGQSSGGSSNNPLGI